MLKEAENMTLTELISCLFWRVGKDDMDAKKTNWSLLKFAILGRHSNVVRVLLNRRRRESLRRKESSRKFGKSLLEPIRKKAMRSPQIVGYLRHSVTNLHLAMAFASPEIVAMLLEAGIPTESR